MVVQPLRRGTIDEHRAVVLLDVLQIERRPGRHVADDHTHNAQEPLEQIFVPHMHAVCLARLELS